MAIFTPISTLFSEVMADLKVFSWRSQSSLLALRATVACVLALLITWGLNISDPTWAALTAFVVVQASRGATLIQTFERIGATLAGVFSALLVLNLFGDNVLIMVLIAIASLTVCFYFSAKSPAPFVWIYGPITFLLVLFSASNVEPAQMGTFAYYRALEISIGSFCGLGVTLLMGTPLAMEGLQKNNLELLRSLSRLSDYCLEVYRAHRHPEEFKAERAHLLKLTDAQAALLRFARQEHRFKSQGQDNDLQLEQIAFMAQEMLTTLYYDDDGTEHEVIQHFSAELAGLKQSMQQSFEAMIVSVETRCQNQDEVLRHLDLWGKTITALIKQTEAFRDECALQFLPTQWIKWYQFLVRQEEFFFLMRDFYSQAPILPAKVNHSAGWKQLYFGDAYHWEYAFKTALAGVLSPFLALYFDLPSGVFLGVVVILCLQVDLNMTRRKLLLLVAGSGIGTLAALFLLSLNLENVCLYLLVLAGLLFVMGRVVHGDPSRSMLGLFAVIIFLVGVTPGISPILDWRNIFLLFMEIIVAAFALLVLLLWIWPFSPQRIFKHYQDQVVWYQGLIRTFILHTLQHKPQENIAPLRQEFNALHQQIRNFENFKWEDSDCQQKVEAVIGLWYRSYHLLAGLVLALKTQDLQGGQNPLPDFMQVVLAATPTAKGLQNVIADLLEYKRLMRERFIAGERLPFEQAIRLVHALNLLEKLAECRRTLIQSYHDFVGVR
ncbi:MAG: FUSC family protein [Gammaproteobacteria bacterium]|nr:FUSC family protein [Gammaproteobacteria bacterium]